MLMQAQAAPGSAPMNLGPHANFIVAAYGAAALVLVALIAWIALDYRAQRRALGELESRGVTRRSRREAGMTLASDRPPPTAGAGCWLFISAAGVPGAGGAVPVPARQRRSVAACRRR